MEPKNVLIVYAHQEPKSFNAALKDVAVETLSGQGHAVTISDLYEMKFDPSASKCNFKAINNTERFDFQRELSEAAERGILPEDISTELAKIIAADLIILQFPMYWLGVPAILKGWLERCFVDKICFNTMTYKWFDDGPLANKKVVLSMTTGGPAGFFSDTGVFGDMDVLLWPLHNSLRFTGLQVLDPHISYAPQEISADERTNTLQCWANRLKTIWTEKPVEFIHIKHFDKENAFQLHKSFMENNSKDIKPTAGQNLGRLKGKPLI